MIGVIAGDVIGSVHEHTLTKSTHFPLFHQHCRFTDDTVLTVATAYAILNGTPYEIAYRDFGRAYPHAGYGGTFYEWLQAEEPRPYNSWGNGSAMRVAPVGFAFGSVDDVLHEAERSAAVTHNHVEGIKGAQATALAVFLARSGSVEGRDKRGVDEALRLQPASNRGPDSTRLPVGRVVPRLCPRSDHCFPGFKRCRGRHQTRRVARW